MKEVGLVHLILLQPQLILLHIKIREWATRMAV